jgi:DNA-binding transcriptional MerR regulator
LKNDYLLSIREFSELTDFSLTKLRHYDDVELFQPVFRADNGYRYYSALQSITINCINVMKSVQLPIKKINDIMKKRTPEKILDFLSKHEVELNAELFKLQQAYAIIHTYVTLIQEGLQADEQKIACRRMEATPIEIGPRNDFSGKRFNDSFFAFLQEMRKRRVDSAYPAGACYTSMDSLRENPGRPEYFFAHTPAGRDLKEKGDYLVGYARGYYGDLGDLPQRLEAYAKAHGMVFNGPVYEDYLHNELTEENPDRYLIRVAAKVRHQKSRHSASSPNPK